MTQGPGDAARGEDAPTDSAGVPWAGRDLKSNPFAGDDGSADPGLAAALVAYGETASVQNLEQVVEALAGARVLIPILAELDSSAPGEFGEQVDKEASAGVVALESPDGRRALPVFSSVAAMADWRSDARPVPALSTRAALSAVAEDWALLVIDPGGPVTALVPRPAVWAIAQGRGWNPAICDGVVDPGIDEAIRTALASVAHVGRVGTEAGRSAEIAVVLGIDAGLDRAGLDRVLAEVNSALASSAVVGERVDSLELRIGTA